MLRTLVDLAEREGVEAVVVAGDIYDRAVPPAEAMELYHELIKSLVDRVGAPILVISGNHDSGRRLAHMDALLARSGVHHYGACLARIEPLELRDDAGPLLFYPAPFSDVVECRHVLEELSVVDCHTAMEAVVQRIAARHPAGVRSVLVGHAYVAGGASSESERPLAIGGAEQIGASLFDSFNYTAMGHLHRRQTCSGRMVHYPGSPYRYSFGECSDVKGCLIVDIDAAGRAEAAFHPLAPGRQVSRVRGYLDDLLRGEIVDDYMQVELLDRHPGVDLAERLRDRFPNLLAVAPVGRDGAAPHAAPDPASISALGLKPLCLEFYESVSRSPLSPTGEQLLDRMLHEMQWEEREAAGAAIPTTPELGDEEEPHRGEGLFA